jgi:hypothetical protein
VRADGRRLEVAHLEDAQGARGTSAAAVERVPAHEDEARLDLHGVHVHGRDRSRQHAKQDGPARRAGACVPPGERGREEGALEEDGLAQQAAGGGAQPVPPLQVDGHHTRQRERQQVRADRERSRVSGDQHQPAPARGETPLGPAPEAGTPQHQAGGGEMEQRHRDVEARRGHRDEAYAGRGDWRDAGEVA